MAWWVLIGAALAATTPATTPPTVPPPAPTVTAAPPPSSTPATTPVTGDPLGCTAVVHDPRGELDPAVVGPAATRAARALGADLHVRAETDVDGGLDARMAQLEAQCPTWWTGTDRASDLVVVMYSSTEREASVFYGPGQSAALEFRWEHAVDEMGPRFADGAYSAGVVAGLEALVADAPVTYRPSSDPVSYADDDEASGSSAGVPAVVWLLLIAVVVVAVVRVTGFVRTGEWSTDDSGDDDTGSGWAPSSRRRSWSSSTSRRSSSSSRRSSSSSSRRSSRRSGGGTKRW